MKICSRCQSKNIIKAGNVNQKQRYKCKECNYFFTVSKQGKSIEPYYIIKGLQLYIEGLSLRQIERLIGVSHVTIGSWVKKYKMDKIIPLRESPSYRILSKEGVLSFFEYSENNKKHKSFIISQLGDRYMMIIWKKRKE